jgi:nucleoside-diphosphate-sugar epimerase
LYRKLARSKLAVELKGGVLTHPTHVSDVKGAFLAVIAEPAPRKSIVDVGGERPVLVQDLHLLIAASLGVRRRRVVLPPAVAAPAAKLARPLLSRLGSANPHLLAFSRGDVLSAAVDDTRFRNRYPSVSILPLTRGVGGHITWARQNGLP